MQNTEGAGELWSSMHIAAASEIRWNSSSCIGPSTKVIVARIGAVGQFDEHLISGIVVLALLLVLLIILLVVGQLGLLKFLKNRHPPCKGRGCG